MINFFFKLQSYSFLEKKQMSYCPYAELRDFEEWENLSDFNQYIEKYSGKT